MRLVFYIFIGCFLFVACHNDDYAEEQVSVHRTLIVYMAADNDLYADALANHKTQPMQVNLLEQQTPKELLPP
jgi:predicted component of type VI protein secretion system